MGKEWLSMVDSLQHISSIAVMEQKLPQQAGGGEMTLWDKDDMAVRMVLEEGKLNMCLRVLQVCLCLLSALWLLVYVRVCVSVCLCASCVDCS